jgi:hypothetical protein
MPASLSGGSWGKSSFVTPESCVRAWKHSVIVAAARLRDYDEGCAIATQALAETLGMIATGAFVPISENHFIGFVVKHSKYRASDLRRKRTRESERESEIPVEAVEARANGNGTVSEKLYRELVLATLVALPKPDPEILCWSIVDRVPLVEISARCGHKGPAWAHRALARAKERFAVAFRIQAFESGILSCLLIESPDSWLIDVVFRDSCLSDETTPNTDDGTDSEPPVARS